MKQREIKGFGERLAALRKTRGLTQTQLGEAVGVSKRVIAYYEGEGNQPPGAMLADLARALGVSSDDLLGLRSPKAIPAYEKTTPKAARLFNRLRKVELLGPADQRAVLKFIDALAGTKGKMA